MGRYTQGLSASAPRPSPHASRRHPLYPFRILNLLEMRAVPAPRGRTAPAGLRPTSRRAARRACGSWPRTSSSMAHNCVISSTVAVATTGSPLVCRPQCIIGTQISGFEKAS